MKFKIIKKKLKKKHKDITKGVSDRRCKVGLMIKVEGGET